MTKGFSNIAILGAGTMGPCIAQVFAMKGSRVKIWSRSEKTRVKAQITLKNNLDVFVAEGEITQLAADKAYERVSFTDSLDEAVKGADFVTETIVEDRRAKAELYSSLEKMLAPSCVLASNTSGLNPFELMPESLLPKAMITHWYTPAQIVPLVDVIKSEQMSQQDCDDVVEFLRLCGKTPVAMKKFINGYIVNRMQMCLNQEIFYLLDNGYCTPEDIDLAVKTSFIPRAVVLGMCRRIDLNGLDIAAKHYINHSYNRPPEVEMPEVLAAHLEKGELGLKTGKGFFDYSGIDAKELLKKRDEQLFEVYRLARKFLEDPV